MLQGRLSPFRRLTRFAFVALLGSVLTGWAATFPLPIPTRPTSFPLQRPAITGTVVAWGFNGNGQLNVPAGLFGVVAIAAGNYHTVALKSDGTVVAWGSNGLGQLNIPTGLNGVVAVAAGGWHTVALKRDGTVVAWGRNYYGQTNVPAGLSDVVAIAAGQYHTVALKRDGLVGPNGATATAQVVNGFMVSVSVIGGGLGYTVPPLVVSREVAGREPRPSPSWPTGRWSGSPSPIRAAVTPACPKCSSPRRRSRRRSGLKSAG